MSDEQQTPELPEENVTPEAPEVEQISDDVTVRHTPSEVPTMVIRTETVSLDELTGGTAGEPAETAVPADDDVAATDTGFEPVPADAEAEGLALKAVDEAEKLAGQAKAGTVAAGAAVAAAAEGATAKAKRFGKRRKGSDVPATADDTAKDVVETAAADTAADAGDAAETTAEPVAAEPTEAQRESSALTSLAVLAAVAALVVAGLATFFAIHPGASTDDNEAFENSRVTAQLMTQATDRVCAPFRLNYKSIDADLKKGRAQMTGQAQKQFDEYVNTTTRKITEQTKATTECQADQVGIVSINGDKATVIAQLIVSVEQNGMPADSNTPRVQYEFQKKGGQWLIAQVNDTE
ncbi:MAG: hypothetical protein QM774_13455 [Gordonia sp. (in: high G+C Gram-positive bacteria)]|uniref:hypothetical protein n=1 Tax=Gordonia sp. (in: high G+C Gram-positive bacteria) TaxID=84139 RepID=UPI0039E46B2B